MPLAQVQAWLVVLHCRYGALQVVLVLPWVQASGGRVAGVKPKGTRRPVGAPSTADMNMQGARRGERISSGCYCTVS